MKVSSINSRLYSNNNKLRQNDRQLASSPSFEGVIKTRGGGVKLSLLPSLAFLAQFIVKPFLELQPLTNLAISVTSLALATFGLDILKKSAKITEKPLQLEKNIEFKKAETIEEAVNFAKTNFKIKKFKVEDLELANWINEGLCNINNRFQGEVYMPSKIVAKKQKEGINGSFNSISDTLKINTLGIQMYY